MRRNPSRPRVPAVYPRSPPVGCRERTTDIAIVTANEMAEKPCTTIGVFPEVVWVDVQHARGSGHELHEADRALVAHGVLVERAFDFSHCHHQRERYSMRNRSCAECVTYAGEKLRH